MSTQICFDSLEILDWYDGPVLAIGTYGELHFLVILIACEIATDNRIFAIFPIDEYWAQLLLRPIEEDKAGPTQVTSFRAQIDSCLSVHQGGAYLTEDNIERGRSIQMYQDSTFSPADFVPYDSNLAFDDQQFETWTQRLYELMKNHNK